MVVLVSGDHISLITLSQSLGERKCITWNIIVVGHAGRGSWLETHQFYKKQPCCNDNQNFSLESKPQLEPIFSVFGCNNILISEAILIKNISLWINQRSKILNQTPLRKLSNFVTTCHLTKPLELHNTRVKSKVELFTSREGELFCLEVQKCYKIVGACCLRLEK